MAQLFWQKRIDTIPWLFKRPNNVGGILFITQTRIITMRYPGGWNKDRWKVTTPGNYRDHYAEHDNGVGLWLTDPGGRGDNWSVMAGTSNSIGDKTYVVTGLPNKRIAEGILEELMSRHKVDPDHRAMKTSNRGTFDF